MSDTVYPIGDMMARQLLGGVELARGHRVLIRVDARTLAWIGLDSRGRYTMRHIAARDVSEPVGTVLELRDPGAAMRKLLAKHGGIVMPKDMQRFSRRQRRARRA